MTLKNQKPLKENLYKQILKLQSVEECEKFFEDLCTIKEIEAMSQRIRAAEMLLAGKTYNEIIEETEISSATLSRVSRCVQYGDGGYRTVLSRKEK